MWPHLWYCIWATHDHHSGCGDLLWLSDAVDDWLAIICLIAFGGLIAWITYDHWRLP